MSTSKEQKEEMRKQIIEFVQQQPNYSKQELRVMCDEPDWFILYGSNGMVGIAGYGKTPQEAVEDFKNSWKQLKGEEWIQKNLPK